MEKLKLLTNRHKNYKSIPSNSLNSDNIKLLDDYEHNINSNELDININNSDININNFILDDRENRKFTSDPNDKSENEESIIIKKKGISTLSRGKFIGITVDNCIFVTKNIKGGYITLSKYTNDLQKRLLYRIFIKKNNIIYVKLKELNNTHFIFYNLIITFTKNENIEVPFMANEAVNIFNFIKRCLKSQNTIFDSI